jgi:hypothetical protein
MLNHGSENLNHFFLHCPMLEADGDFDSSNYQKLLPGKKFYLFQLSVRTLYSELLVDFSKKNTDALVGACKLATYWYNRKCIKFVLQ